MSFDRHLIIDGSNIMNAWPELRRVLKQDRNAARSRLSLMLSTIHDVEQIKVVIVFDGRGDDLQAEMPSQQPTFIHLHTPAGVTADDVIERLVGQASDPQNYHVATDDRAEQQTITAAGARVISSAELVAWVERAEQRQHAQVSGLRRKNDQEWRREKS